MCWPPHEHDRSSSSTCSTSGRRLGYGVTDAGDTPASLVYGERTLSADPNVRQRNDEPFAHLDYAIYLGEEVDSQLLDGQCARPAPRRTTGRRTTPFGDNELLIVMSPTDGHLSSALFANLWWIVALIGGLASVVVAATQPPADRAPRRGDRVWRVTTSGCTTSNATSPRRCN